MSDQSTEVQIALLLQRQADMERHLKETNDAIKELQDERTRALKWGIGTLGAAVLAMGSWMWTFVTGQLK